MFKKFLVCLMVLCFTLSFSKISLAEEESFDLGEVVVTATKTPHLLKDVPGSVTVITKEEIEESGAVDLGEALEKVGGIKIRDYGSMGAATDITIRGSTPSQVLVLIDGRPTALPSLGTTDLTLYPVDNIERIEVVRGPFSSLYGADALGGVVNIITKDAPEKPTTEFDLSYGTFNTQIYQMSYGAKKGKFGYFITGGKNSSDGDRKNSGCDGKHLATKLSYDISEDAKLSLSLGYLYQSLDVPGSLSWPSPNAHQNDEKDWADLTYNLKLGESSDIMAKLFFNRHWLEYKNPHIFFPSDSETKVNQVGLELQQNLSLNEMNLLTYGVAHKRDEVEVDDKIKDTSMIGGGKELSTTGIYLQDEINFEALPLTLVPGLRYDAPSAYEKRVSPKMSALYKLREKTGIRASVGAAYRAPTVDDLYWYEDWGWGMGAYGNPDLKPEKSTSWDLGVEHQFNEKVLARTTYFRSEVKDLITWAETLPDRWVVTNVDKALIQGVEAESKFQFSPEIFASLSYTYTDARDKGETYYDKYLLYQPRDKVDCTLGYENKNGFKAGIGVEYIGSTYSDRDNTETRKLNEYPLLSARVSKTIGKYAEVYLVGKNLTDEEYQVYRNYPMPGMSVTGGVKIKF